MRILLASDLHYRLRQFDWLARAAPDFDVVVVAGDHVDSFLGVPVEVQVAALGATLGAMSQGTRVIVCSGNHDLDARNAHGEMAAAWVRRLAAQGVAVDGDTVQVGDTLFTVCPWWDGPASRAEVESQLLAASAHRSPGMRWVWIHHAPPQCALSWNGKRHFADAALAALIERHAPDVVLCGHIHEAPFRNGGSWVDRIGRTWLFNAGHQIGDVPARVEIDLDAGEARWISLAGEEVRALAVEGAQ